MNVNFPFFSIVIPVYNAENYIVRCIESCIKQSFKNIEILIVDDCGKDNSIDLIHHYTISDNRVRIIKNSVNLGLFHARLQGFKAAKGKYCLSLDADDFLEKNICRAIYDILSQNPNIDMCHFCFKKNPWHISNLLTTHSPHFGYLYQQNIQKFLNLSNTFHTMWGKVVRTSFLVHIAQECTFVRPPLNFFEDGIFNLLLSFKIKIYYGLDDIGYFYQTNPYSLTRHISYLAFEKKYHDFLKILKLLPIIEKRYGNQTIIKKYRNKILSAFFLEARFFKHTTILKIALSAKIQINPLLRCTLTTIPVFWSSCIISMIFFYRWQTLARLLINIFSFGKIKL